MKEVKPGMFVMDNKDKCPCCGAILNAFANPVGPERPNPGDASMCSKCTSYLMIGDDLKVREMTVDELLELPDEVLVFLTSNRARIKQYNDSRMNAFRQHFPKFIDAPDSARAEIPFLDTSDLLTLECVQRFTQHSDFTKFVKSDNRLMAILDGGERWLVVGYIKHPERVDLPTWTQHKDM